MEINTQINNDRNIRIHKVECLISVEELKQRLIRLYQSPEYNPNMNALWDLRAADTSAVTADEVRSLADMVKHHWSKESNSKYALVVSKEVDYGLSRMYEMLLSDDSPHNVMVFKDCADAERWLEG